MAKNVEHVSHIKSKLKTNGLPQLPTADKLVDGEIAINYAEGVETISIRNENSAITTFSSDNYYTEQKLGDDFTGATTVTDKIDEVNVSNGVTPSRDSVEIWVDTSDEAIPTAFDVYTKTEVNSLLDKKSNTGHTHQISDVNNLQINLDAKVNKSEFNTYSGTVSTQINGMNTILNDFTNINILGGVNVDARGYGESTPTIAVYAGSKEKLVEDVLSHFKLGWFDGDGNLVKECAPGRISSDKNGNDIPIDGTLEVDGKKCDLLVYTDVELYRDRLTTNSISVNGSTASTFNVIGLGLAYHAVGNVPAKKFEPFAFTPHCAKYSGNKGYSYYDGGNVQTSINSLASSVNALNKGGGYMGLYYEFYEIWLMAMYLELGTLDFANEELFGRGCTNGTPNLNNWYTNSLEGGGGCMYTGNTFGSFWTNTVTTYNFAEMLEAQRIMDGITKAGFANQIGGNKLYTYDSNGNVISVTADTDPSTWEKSSGMEVGKKYFTVKNVTGCKGLADGVMTGIVNIYVKDTDRIRKYSHPVYRGLDLLSVFFTHLEGIHYVVKHTGTTASLAQSQELFYANSWKDVSTNTSLYANANSIVTASTAEGLVDDPLLVANYVNGGSFPTGSDGWGKQTDYNISLFAHKSIGASQHTYECGYIWYRGTSWSSPAGTDNNGWLTTNAKSANASVVGCDASVDNAGRTLNAYHSVSNSFDHYAGGFAHPQIKV
jgi:hypothetical protein